MNQPARQPGTNTTRPSRLDLLAAASPATRVSLVSLGIAVIFLFYSIYAAVQNPEWQQWVAVGAALLLGASSAISAYLSRRGRALAGISLLIGTILAANLAGPFLYTGLGLLCALTAVFLTSMIALLTLPRRYALWSTGAGLVVALLALLPDWLNLAGRVPAVSPLASWLLVASMVMIYAAFLASQFQNYTMRTKLIVAFLGMILTSLGLVTVLNNYAAQASLIDVANQRLLGSAAQMAVRLDSFIQFHQQALESEAKLPLFGRYLGLASRERAAWKESLEVTSALHALSQKDPNILSYALLDAEGLNVADTDPYGVGLLETSQSYYQTPLQTGRAYVSPVLFARVNNRAYLYFSSPVRDPQGKIIGVLRARYDASVLQKLVEQDNNRSGIQTFGLLLDENGLRLADGFAPEVIFKLDAPLDAARLAELRAAGRIPDWPPAELSTGLRDFAAGLARSADRPVFSSEVHTGDIDEDVRDPGVEQIAVVPLKSQPWQVAFVQPREVLLAPARSQTRLILSVSAMIALVVAGAGILLGQYLAGPIIRLTSVARRVTAGEFTAQARVEAQDETGQLAVTFNTMTTRLRELIGSLEDQVQARTAELTLSMEVGQRAAQIRDVAELLATITDFIGSRFGLYYTQIYFMDELGQNLVLQAGTGQVGAELLSRRHSLPMANNSIVGRAATQDQAVVVPDTTQSEIHRPNPLLPLTRSELAVPLRVEGRVIGVLDMQASQTQTFTGRNLTVFEAMATQLALSIDSARQWTLAQAAQQRAEAALRQLTREGWTTRLGAGQQALGFTYDLSSVTPLKPNGTAAPAANSLSAPVVVQNEPIGRLAVAVPPAHSLTDDERVLVEAVARQLAQKAENLRLFEITQQRAAREQLARQIVDRIRASRDIETALKTAAAELGQALGVAQTVIDLNVNPVDDSTNE